MHQPPYSQHCHDLTNNSHYFSTLGWSLLEILQLWSMKPVQHPVHQLGKLLKLLVSSAPQHLSPVLTVPLSLPDGDAAFRSPRANGSGSSGSPQPGQWQCQARPASFYWQIRSAVMLVVMLWCTEYLYFISIITYIDYYCNCNKLSSGRPGPQSDLVDI